MKKYPEYIFVCSQAQQYAWMKEYYPDIWNGIKDAVRRGQWEPVGSMWVEVDCNLASGESIVRQILYGKQFFKQEFDYETRDVWLPDVFGYAASMPQIMQKAGVDYFLTQKISWNQFNKFPHHTFAWEGIDGTRIFSHFPPADSYIADTGPKELIHHIDNFKEHDRATRSILIYGWGDGGGGPEHRDAREASKSPGLGRIAQDRTGESDQFLQRRLGGHQGHSHMGWRTLPELHRGTYTTHAQEQAFQSKV